MSIVSDDRWTCPYCLETFTFWSRVPEMLRLQRTKAQEAHTRRHNAENRRKRSARHAS
jgi:hypothetical protein